MTSKKSHTIYIGIIILIGFSRCASMLPLSGGEKDITPPKIISQVPENKTINFSGDEIKIDFDEFIQLRDVNGQLIITPRLTKDPEVTAAGKTLRLKFKESLQPNTTYNINFGSSVVDLHEGNILSGLAIVFSTGRSLDSLSISGKILDAFTLKPAEANVFLYANADDSCIFKSKPDYFVKSDKDGNYKINYIKAGNYKIIALGDKNKNFMYEQADEMIAPAVLDDKSQKIILQNENIDFKLYKEEPSKFFLKRTSYPLYGQVVFSFNKGMKEPALKIDNKDKDNVSYFFSGHGDTLFAFYKKGISDTSALYLSNNKKVTDTLYIYKQPEEKFGKDLKAKRLSPKITGISTGLKAQGIIIRFDQPVISIDNSKIRFINAKDTSGVKEKFSVSESSPTDIISSQNAGIPFKGLLFLLPGAVKGFGGLENDSIRCDFEVKAKEDLGTVTLKLVFPCEGDYKVQLINEKGIPHAEEFYCSAALSKGMEQTFIFSRVVPGNYSIRLIKDENKDMEWTTGNFLKQIAPEKVYYYNKPIKVLADWEINIDWKAE